jgi:hypothetical protein
MAAKCREEMTIASRRDELSSPMRPLDRFTNRIFELSMMSYTSKVLLGWARTWRKPACVSRQSVCPKGGEEKTR